MRRRRIRSEIAIWIERQDYDAFKALCPNDPDVPDTFDEWLQHASEHITKAEARGDTANKVIVHPQEFTRFCAASGIETNYTTLRAYAVALAHKRK